MNRPSPAARFAIAIATAIAVIGSLTTVSPAHAYPPVPLLPPDACFYSGYQFPGGGMTINYPGIGVTRFNAPRGTRVDTSAETFYENGTSLKGTITGDINRYLISFTVTRGPKYPPLRLSGSVGGRTHRASGGYFYDTNEGDWDMTQELVCLPGAPPPPPKPDESKPVAADNIDPARQGLGTATVVADTDMYDKPDGLGQKIGTLLVGEEHPLMEPCRNDWCRIGTIELGGFPGLPNGTAWVYAKGFLTIA